MSASYRALSAVNALALVSFGSFSPPDPGRVQNRSHSVERGKSNSESLSPESRKERLSECLVRGRYAEAKRLLLAGVPLENRKIPVAVDLACGERDPRLLRNLLHRGISPETLNEYGQTPLQRCIILGNRRGALAVLRAGANPNTAYATGRTPLMVAAAVGDLILVRALLRAGAEPWLRDREGRDALSLAREGRYKRVISVLRDAVRSRAR